MASEALIVLEDVRARRGGFALSVPSWRVPAGAVVGVVGPNGAGKTTLLELLPGLSPRDGGRILVDGHDPARDPAAVRTALGFMSDEMPLFDLRVDRLLRTLSGYYAAWDEALVAELMRRFELDPRRHVRRLSKGEGTRLRLVCAMAFQPRVLVLDEPATGLDVSGRRALLQVVLDVVRDPARSVVISSHQLGDVERIADRLLVLSAGQVVREGPTDDLVGEGRTLEEALLSWGAA
jgi:ABC-2 type transport system ATP-binding protein